MFRYTDEQIKFIIQLKSETEITYDDLAVEFETKFGIQKTGNALEKIYRKFKHECRFESSEDDNDVLIKNLKANHSARRTSAKLRKENKTILDHQITLDEFLEKFQQILENAKLNKVSIPKKPKSKNKTKMIVEPMLSDIHYGLETKSYNADVARKRVSHYAQSTIKEIKRKEQLYSIEKIHVPLLADFLQSATMHKDSGQACHLTNAEQMAVTIESLFYDFILPIAQTGYPVEITGLCGNHDREASEQHTVNPGKTYFTYTIYKTLEMLCTQTGLKKIKFDIPNSVYSVKELLGKHFLYEHGHTLKSASSDSLEKHLIKRQAQVGKILSGIRIGHFHNDRSDNLGRHVVNASSVSDDHYGDLLGYKSRPAQMINFYVECDRDTSFYHSFAIDLSGVE